MEYVAIVLTALIAGGIAGTLINVLATRLPAEGDPSIIGLPIRQRSGREDPLALLPYVGAWQPTERQIEWPKLATDLAAAAIVAIGLWHFGFDFDGLRASI